jgi:hypothetical protein
MKTKQLTKKILTLQLLIIMFNNFITMDKGNEESKERQNSRESMSIGNSKIPVTGALQKENIYEGQSMITVGQIPAKLGQDESIVSSTTSDQLIGEIKISTSSMADTDQRKEIIIIVDNEEFAKKPKSYWLKRESLMSSNQCKRKYVSKEMALKGNSKMAVTGALSIEQKEEIYDKKTQQIPEKLGQDESIVSSTTSDQLIGEIKISTSSMADTDQSKEKK